MPVRIAKTFRWEMGHRLPGHAGACRNLHGHSYRLQVEIEGEPDAAGMVLDFDVLSTAVRGLLRELDHACLCDEGDAALVAFLREQGMKHLQVPFPPTVENLGRMFAERLRPALAARSNVSGFALTVHETETSCARIDVDLRRP